MLADRLAPLVSGDSLNRPLRRDPEEALWYRLEMDQHQGNAAWHRRFAVRQATLHRLAPAVSGLCRDLQDVLAERLYPLEEGGDDW